MIVLSINVFNWFIEAFLNFGGLAMLYPESSDYIPKLGFLHFIAWCWGLPGFIGELLNVTMV